jgi:archaellum biogenesis protein FlaJ (TadC family)
VERKRLIGVTIIGWIEIVLGLIALIWGLGATLYTLFGSPECALFVPILLFSILIPLGIYTLKLNPAARIITIFFLGIIVIYVVILLHLLLTEGGGMDLVSLYCLFILSPLSVIIYLILPKVKEQFVPKMCPSNVETSRNKPKQN